MIGRSGRVDQTGLTAMGQGPMWLAGKVHRSTVRAVALSCVMAVLLAACDSHVARANQGARSSLPGWVMNVPLSKVLPTKHFATLGEGVVRDRRWAILAFANDRPGADKRPCIKNVILRYERGLIVINHGAPSCGPLTPPKSVPVTTEYLFTNVSGGVVGMTLGLSIAHVRLHFSTGADLDVSTKLLNRRQAKKAKVRPFRYVALGLHRKACLEAFEGISKGGSTLFQTSPQECMP